MNRRSVIKILAEIDFKPPIVAKAGITKSLISDLQLLTPQFYKGMIEKYGSHDFTWWLTKMGEYKDKPQDSNYFWFESNRIPETNGNKS